VSGINIWRKICGIFEDVVAIESRLLDESVLVDVLDGEVGNVVRVAVHAARSERGLEEQNGSRYLGSNSSIFYA